MPTWKNQRAFAAKIGVSRHTVSEWEKRGVGSVLRTMNPGVPTSRGHRRGPGTQQVRRAASQVRRAASPARAPKG
ncbi:hypothetical protein [Streptomyces sp. NPDC005322]|uniref:hypothetical protein n=1 Tax=Streptomyces sp. NPDC005322 TaxID=3157032 RepID=UPI0033ABB526